MSPPLIGTRTRDEAIEGLRGMAALVVFYHHLTAANLGGWSPSPWFSWPVEASAAVLIFFVLSGYVIGLSSSARADAPAIKHYVWRRFVRLVPINIFAVLLACAVAPEWDLPMAVSNILFLQNSVPYGDIWWPAIYTNGNLWSLNHEVVFYFLFIFVWYFRPRLAVIVLTCVFLVVAAWYTAFVPVFIGCYAAGFLFWLAGLALAWHARSQSEYSVPWPSLILLGLLTWKLQPFRFAFENFPSPYFAGPTVKLQDLAFLPVAILLVAAVAQRGFRFQPFIVVVAVLLPVGGFIFRLEDSGMVLSLDDWAIAGAGLMAFLLWRWSPPVSWFRHAAPLGGISFALYATARPIQEFIFRQTTPNTAGGFLGAAIATILVSFGFAWFLERRLQPGLHRVLLPRFNPHKRTMPPPESKRVPQEVG